jgi:hypothetical protein
MSSPKISDCVGNASQDKAEISGPPIPAEKIANQPIYNGTDKPKQHKDNNCENQLWQKHEKGIDHSVHRFPRFA